MHQSPGGDLGKCPGHCVCERFCLERGSLLKLSFPQLSSINKQSRVRITHSQQGHGAAIHLPHP
jgi:hypothetical protein